MIAPARGEIWWANLDPTQDREQAGRRPVLIISEDAYNQGPAELVIVLPLTRTLRNIRSRVRVRPPEVPEESDILCDHIRSISKGRLFRRWGVVAAPTMRAVEERLRIILGL